MADINGTLEQALTAVLNTQATMQQTNALLAQSIVRIELELAAIRSEQSDIRTILVRHEELLRGLPEALQRRIGFQGPVS